MNERSKDIYRAADYRSAEEALRLLRGILEEIRELRRVVEDKK